MVLIPREMSDSYYMRGIADFTSLEVVWFSPSRDVGVVWIWSSRDVRLVLHAGNRRFYFSRGGMVLIPREMSGSYYMWGIADFTSLEVRLDGMV